MQFLASEIKRYIPAGYLAWEKASEELRGKLLLKAEEMIRANYGSIDAFNSAHRRAVVMQAGYLMCGADGFCDDVVAAFIPKPDSNILSIHNEDLSQLRLLINTARTFAQKIAAKASKSTAKVNTEFVIGADAQAKITKQLFDSKGQTINTEAIVSPDDQAAMAEKLSGTVDYANPLSNLIGKVLENLDTAADDIIIFLGDKEDDET